jgi:hypothetical protein
MSGPAQGRSVQRPAVLVAITLLALVLALLLLGQRAGEPSLAPGATASASATVAGAGTTAGVTPTAAASATSSVTSGAQPDARHGLITRNPAAMRSEADPTPLNKTPNWDDGAPIGVSPDGRRVAVLRSGQTGQGIISFTTAKPDDIAYVMDMMGTGELIVGPPVWAADGSDSLLVGIIKPGAQSTTEPPPAYSALRSVDVKTRSMTELVRTTNNLVLLPVLWRPGGAVATAYETGPGGFAINYVVVRGQQVTRMSFDGGIIGGTVKANQDGTRVLAIGRDGSSVRWWPYDRLDQQNELKPPPGDGFYRVEWRPFADEVVVAVGPAGTAGPRTVEETRLEVWGL